MASLVQEHSATHLALALARAPVSMLDAEVERGLRFIGTECKIDVLSICVIEGDSLQSPITWSALGWEEPGLEMAVDRATWWCDALAADRDVIIDSLEDFPLEAAVARGAFRARNTSSVAAFPLRCDTIGPAFVLAERRDRPLRWTRSTVELLASAAESIAVALDRKNREKSLRGELEQARQIRLEQTSFLAEFAHELRSPLTAITGYSELLQAEYCGALNQEQQGYVGDVLLAARHLAAVIEGTLALARMDGGELELNAKEIDLETLLRDCVAQVLPRARKAGLTTDYEIRGAERRVCVDGQKLRQVLINLLVNAVKFTPEGGRIAVRANIRADDYEVDVEDTGVGISQRDQRRVFQRFARVQDSPAPNAGPGEGSGLGLSLVERLVALHGGVVTVKSELGAGSRFRILMPRWVQSRRKRRAFLGGVARSSD